MHTFIGADIYTIPNGAEERVVSLIGAVDHWPLKGCECEQRNVRTSHIVEADSIDVAHRLQRHDTICKFSVYFVSRTFNNHRNGYSSDSQATRRVSSPILSRKTTSAR